MKDNFPNIEAELGWRLFSDGFLTEENAVSAGKIGPVLMFVREQNKLREKTKEKELGM